MAYRNCKERSFPTKSMSVFLLKIIISMIAVVFVTTGCSIPNLYNDAVVSPTETSVAPTDSQIVTTPEKTNAPALTVAPVTPVITKAPTPKPNTQFAVDKTCLSRISITLGGLKKLFGKVTPEFEFHSEYSIKDPHADVWYYFTAKDWTADDSDYCMKISAPLGVLVPTLKSKITVVEFTKNLHSDFADAPASYQIMEGQPTSYYISEHYALVSFSVATEKSGPDDAPGFGAGLEIDLGSGNTVTPDSQTWLKNIAG